MNHKKVHTPVAKKEPVKFKMHGDIRIDNYHWMRISDAQKNASVKDEHTQEVIDYLRLKTLIMTL